MSPMRPVLQVHLRGRQRPGGQRLGTQPPKGWAAVMRGPSAVSCSLLAEEPSFSCLPPKCSRIPPPTTCTPTRPGHAQDWDRLNKPCHLGPQSPRQVALDQDSAGTSGAPGHHPALAPGRWCPHLGRGQLPHLQQPSGVPQAPAVAQHPLLALEGVLVARHRAKLSRAPSAAVSGSRKFPPLP